MSTLRAFSAARTLEEGGCTTASQSSALPVESEWDEYLTPALSTSSEDTALLLWRAHAKLFPRIALGARYFLSFPATSVASELVLSKAGRTITKSRARLTGAHAENYIVLNDNLLRHGME